MHELDCGGDADVAGARIVAQLRRGERQHGPQALAARIDEMVGELRNKVDLGYSLVEDDAVDALHVGSDEVHQRLYVFRRVARAFQCYDLTQGGFPDAAWLRVR